MTLIHALLFAAVLPAAGWAQVVAPPQPSSGTLDLDRHAVTLGPAGSARIHAYGTSKFTVTTDGDAVEVTPDLPSRSLLVVARHLGNATVTVTDGSGNVGRIAVAVLPLAGVIPGTVNVNLAGAPSATFAFTSIREAVRQAARSAPGTVTALGIDASAIAQPMSARTTLDVPVRIAGPNYAEVDGTVQVVISVDPRLKRIEPTTLLYSDDPETVPGAALLFRSSAPIDVSHPARLFAYHAAGRTGQELYLVFRTKGQASQIQLTGAAVGPSGDAVCVGHEAGVLYLERRLTGEGAVVDATASSPGVIRLSARTMPAGTTVTAIYDITVSGGDPIDVAVVAVSDGADPRAYLDAPEAPSDGIGRRGEYDLRAVHPLALSYTAGGGDVSVRVADASAAPSDDVVPLRSGGVPLKGHYGVIRPIVLTLTNPTDSVQQVYLFESPLDGTDTATLWFAGEQAPVEVTRMTDTASKYLLRSFSLQPRATISAQALFMSEGGSFYPAQLGLTSSVPSGKVSSSFDACSRAVEPWVS